MPGHIRDAFCAWVDEQEGEFDGGEQIQVGWNEDTWTLRRLLGTLWRCTDIMPSSLCEELDLRAGSTYATAAHRLLANAG